MKLSPMKDILETAEEGNIAYGAYVTVFCETALAAIEASTELDTPAVSIAGTDCCDSMGGFEGTVDTVKRIVKTADRKAPVALHLGHCRTYGKCVQAMQAGCPSVMTDGSSPSFEKNVVLTKKATDYAHCYGITVEGELGEPMGEEGNFKVEGNSKSAQADSDQIKEFAEHTDTDHIAVSIGTQHGVYVAAPHLNIERLKKMRDVVDVPIVPHGGSGTPKEQVQEAVRNRIRKISIVADVLIVVASSFEDMKQRPDFKYNTGMFVSSQACARELTKGKMRESALMDQYTKREKTTYGKEYEQIRMWVDGSHDDGYISSLLRRSGGDKASSSGRQ